MHMNNALCTTLYRKGGGGMPQLRELPWHWCLVNELVLLPLEWRCQCTQIWPLYENHSGMRGITQESMPLGCCLKHIDWKRFHYSEVDGVRGRRVHQNCPRYLPVLKCMGVFSTDSLMFLSQSWVVGAPGELYHSSCLYPTLPLMFFLNHVLGHPINKSLIPALASIVHAQYFNLETDCVHRNCL